ncbi:MAG: pantoate--beta-alanine ligase [Gammaproteobacteria bacterium]|nr:pantoate--beta-alanine ligase [Gammaproteobacteria bacterium]
MQIFSELQALRQCIAAWRAAGQTIAFVPTMGNLHEGHASLIERARERGDKVVVSIYVNPLQFGLNEDWSKYPRTLEEDCAILRAKGVDALFTPTDAIMYPRGRENQTIVEVPALSNILCGASRPGHFRGVATVVAKLFNLVQPDIAVFGEKDFQQLMVIRQMVADLSVPVEIVGAETKRAEDGLALSSRNGYLTPEERAQAPVIYRALSQCAEALKSGERDFARLEEQANLMIEKVGLKPDYFKIRHGKDLHEPRAGDSYFVILAAAFLGRARLIDNVQVWI